MIDLINNVDKLIIKNKQSIIGLVNHYSSVLEYIKPERQYPYYAFIINVCINHLKVKHNELPKNWKAWTVLLVVKLYNAGKIITDEDIIKTIDEFIIFWKSEFNNYCKEIISVTEDDRDRGFMYRFYFKNK